MLCEQLRWTWCALVVQKMALSPSNPVKQTAHYLIQVYHHSFKKWRWPSGSTLDYHSEGKSSNHGETFFSGVLSDGDGNQTTFRLCAYFYIAEKHQQVNVHLKRWWFLVNTSRIELWTWSSKEHQMGATWCVLAERIHGFLRSLGSIYEHVRTLIQYIRILPINTCDMDSNMHGDDKHHFSPILLVLLKTVKHIQPHRTKNHIFQFLFSQSELSASYCLMKSNHIVNFWWFTSIFNLGVLI